MPKADNQPPQVRSLNDLLLIGMVRKPRNPLQGLIGAVIVAKVKDRRP